jgi:hypothetical protein
MPAPIFCYEVLTNTNVGAGRWRLGYQPVDRLIATGSGTVDADDRDGALEAVFARYNADDRPNAASAPSLSVGDVVVLDGENAFACRPRGWEPVALEPGSVHRDRSWSPDGPAPVPAGTARGLRIIDDWWSYATETTDAASPSGVTQAGVEP